MEKPGSSTPLDNDKSYKVEGQGPAFRGPLQQGNQPSRTAAIDEVEQIRLARQPAGSNEEVSEKPTAKENPAAVDASAAIMFPEAFRYLYQEASPVVHDIFRLAPREDGLNLIDRASVGSAHGLSWVAAPSSGRNDKLEHRGFARHKRIKPSVSKSKSKPQDDSHRITHKLNRCHGEIWTTEPPSPYDFLRLAAEGIS